MLSKERKKNHTHTNAKGNFHKAQLHKEISEEDGFPEDVYGTHKP